MSNKYISDLVDNILGTMDELGFTTENPDNVEKLKWALNDLISDHTSNIMHDASDYDRLPDYGGDDDGGRRDW
jgi:hypothetical protein